MDKPFTNGSRSPLSRFYFHLVTPEGAILDEEGRELRGMEEARQEALSVARGLIKAVGLRYDRGRTSRIVIEDAHSAIVVSLDIGVLGPVLAKGRVTRTTPLRDELTAPTARD